MFTRAATWLRGDFDQQLSLCVSFLITLARITRTSRAQVLGWAWPTVSDNIRLQIKLLDHLGVATVQLAFGYSMGAMQVRDACKSSQSCACKAHGKAHRFTQRLPRPGRNGVDVKQSVRAVTRVNMCWSNQYLSCEFASVLLEHSPIVNLANGAVAVFRHYGSDPRWLAPDAFNAWLQSAGQRGCTRTTKCFFCLSNQRSKQIGAGTP
jgi:hypothetical protein